jgi:hypothetical protein
MAERDQHEVRRAPPTLTTADLTALLPESQLALRAENKSPGTIEVYTDGARRYLRWCEASDAAPMARASLHTWMAQMLEAGAAPGTVRTRQLAAKRQLPRRGSLGTQPLLLAQA